LKKTEIKTVWLTLNKHPEEGGEVEVSEEDVGDAHHHTGVEEVVLERKKEEFLSF